MQVYLGYRLWRGGVVCGRVGRVCVCSFLLIAITTVILKSLPIIGCPLMRPMRTDAPTVEVSLDLLTEGNMVDGRRHVLLMFGRCFSERMLGVAIGFEG